MKKLVYTSVLALLASSAYAADTAHRGDQFYGRAEVGASMPAAKLDRKVFGKMKPVFGLGAGYRIDNTFRVELAVRHAQQGKHSGAVKSADINKISLGGVNYDVHTDKDTTAISKWKSWSVLVNGFYDISINNSTFTPYVMAGLGYGLDTVTTSYGDAKLVATPASGAALDGPSSIKFKKKGLAWNLGFGTRIHLSKQCDLDLGYRFVGLTGKMKSKIAFGNQTISETSPTKAHGVHQVAVGLIYYF
jgi:opacity protein-like surface antigen